MEEEGFLSNRSTFISSSVRQASLQASQPARQANSLQGNADLRAQINTGTTVNHPRRDKTVDNDEYKIATYAHYQPISP